MKVLYIASNPTEHGELMIEREITELQRRFLSAAGEPAELINFPSLHIEELGLELSKHRPDVLHISAHGDQEELALSNADGKLVPLTAKMLIPLLNTDRPPRLVYLNACNSRTIAQSLSNLIPMAIGTTAPITNRAARASAVLFYDRLLSGMSVQNAFEAGRATIEALQYTKAASILFCRKGVDPKAEKLYLVPRILARFVDDDFFPDKHDFFAIQFGVYGCPGNTSQIVLFTDDESFIPEINDDGENDKENLLASSLCWVVRTNPIRNVIWSESEENIFGDFRLFATGITAAGAHFTVQSTLCDALESYYQLGGVVDGSSPVPAAARIAIEQLRSLDGSQLPVPKTVAQSRPSPAKGARAGLMGANNTSKNGNGEENIDQAGVKRRVDDSSRASKGSSSIRRKK